MPKACLCILFILFPMLCYTLTFLPSLYSNFAWTHSQFSTTLTMNNSLTLLSKCLWEDRVWKYNLTSLWVHSLLARNRHLYWCSGPASSGMETVVSLGSWNRLSNIHWRVIPPYTGTMRQESPALYFFQWQCSFSAFLIKNLNFWLTFKFLIKMIICLLQWHVPSVFPLCSTSSLS